MATIEVIGTPGKQLTRSGSQPKKAARNATVAFSITRGDDWQLKWTEPHKPLQADRALSVT